VQHGPISYDCAPAAQGPMLCAWLDNGSIGFMSGEGSESESIALMLKVHDAVVKG
jgi:hypothetical protein